MDIITTQQCIFIVLYVEPKIWIRNRIWRWKKTLNTVNFTVVWNTIWIYFPISQKKFTISMIFDHFTVMNTLQFVIKFKETKFIRTNQERALVVHKKWYICGLTMSSPATMANRLFSFRFHEFHQVWAMSISLQLNWYVIRSKWTQESY